MVWMPENGGGRDARSMAPTTASAPPLVGYLVVPGLNRTCVRYLPEGRARWRNQTRSPVFLIDLMFIRSYILWS